MNTSPFFYFVIFLYVSLIVQLNITALNLILVIVIFVQGGYQRTDVKCRILHLTKIALIFLTE